jgi:hypothetical protein
VARGFGATFGSGSTDRIATSKTDHATQRTWGIWAYRNGLGGGSVGRVWDKGGAEILRVNDASDFRFHRGWSSNAGTWTFPLIATGAWRHILIAYNAGATGNDPLVWVDGVAQTVTQGGTPAGTVNTNADPYQVGNSSGGTQAWDGILAEFAVWDALLGLAEAQQLADGVSSLLIRPDALVSYAPLIREALDLMGSGALTLTGTAVQPHPRLYLPWPAQLVVPSAVVAVTTTAAGSAAGAGAGAAAKSTPVTAVGPAAGHGSGTSAKAAAVSGSGSLAAAGRSVVVKAATPTASGQGAGHAAASATSDRSPAVVGQAAGHGDSALSAARSLSAFGHGGAAASSDISTARPATSLGSAAPAGRAVAAGDRPASAQGAAAGAGASVQTTGRPETAQGHAAGHGAATASGERPATGQGSVGAAGRSSITTGQATATTGQGHAAGRGASEASAARSVVVAGSAAGAGRSQVVVGPARQPTSRGVLRRLPRFRPTFVPVPPPRPVLVARGRTVQAAQRASGRGRPRLLARGATSQAVQRAGGLGRQVQRLVGAPRQAAPLALGHARTLLRGFGKAVAPQPGTHGTVRQRSGRLLPRDRRERLEWLRAREDALLLGLVDSSGDEAALVG